MAYLILNGVPSSNRTPSALLLGLTFALFGVATARLPEALAFSSRDARRALVVDEIHDCLHRLDTGGHGDLSIAYRHLEGRLIAYRPLTATRSARRYYRTHYAAASTMVGDFERDMSMGAQGRPPDERPDARQQLILLSVRVTIDAWPPELPTIHPAMSRFAIERQLNPTRAWLSAALLTLGAITTVFGVLQAIASVYNWFPD